MFPPMTLVAIALAVVFYGITGYHLVLIVLGLRLARRGRPPFDKGSLRNPVDLPRVSLVIPVKNEKGLIEGAIRCARALEYPRDLLEIIIAEDGSDDGTPEVIRHLQSQDPNLVVLTGGVSKGKPAALNRAMAVAKGEVIAVFDADARYDADLLLLMAKLFHDDPETEVAQAIPTIVGEGSSVIGQLNAYEMRFWYEGLHRGKEKYGLFMHLAGTGLFVQRAVFDRLGPWDEDSLAEDLEFARRFQAAGGKASLLPAEVRILPTHSSRDLLRQRRRWWAGTLQVFWKHLRTPSNPRLSFRLRADTTTHLSSPLLFLVGTVLLFGSLAFFLATGGRGVALTAWLLGFLAASLSIAPLIVLESVVSRQPRLLLLIPGLYWYWILQVVALGVSLVFLLTRRKLRWERTPKVAA